VHRVLAWYSCARLAHLDRAAAVRPRRYERHRPGQVVHVDVKKLASFADLKRILGLDTLTTLTTLTTRSILATAYQVAGRLDDA
jgi:hypothetical protein